ncbi:hypothetical protein PVL29_004411 [Vitis rotundifolia]|uniref:Aberrant root formation protein 4 n=1 Tax=Vitis rotundifolia TaxID=103349 RepID=A0AA39A842_VITRO|nr:hypothetical protein PVL29_004411 [Vitis rotundifolia]
MSAVKILEESSSANPLVLRLQQILTSCSRSIETGDLHKSGSSVSELVNYLDSISDAALSDTSNEESRNNAFEVLSEIHLYICQPLLDQAVVDALSFELPKAVAKFACVSGKCLEIVESIVNQFVATCSPRDLIPIFCEALDVPSGMSKAPSYYAPFLSGLSKVFLSIPRRHFEQVKEAVPVILSVLKAMTSELDDEDTDSEDLFVRAISIANSIQTVCGKLAGRLNEKLRALLGLFVLQIMSLLCMREKVSSCLTLVLQLSHFLPYCGLSYLGLLTGCDVDTIIDIVLKECTEDGDDYMSCFPYVKHGASLAVICGHMSNTVAQSAEEDLTVLKDALQSNQTKRWQAVGMLKHIFSSANLPWELKKHTINFLLWIMDGNLSEKCNDEVTDFSSYVPGLFASLQAIEMVIMYTSDAVLRRNAFDSFKKTAILVDCVREEMRRENCQRISVGHDEFLQAEKSCQSSLFWSADVLELVELILRPPKGGPPALPEDSDAVLSALNLYRFVLITESTGKTNCTGVLSKNNLHKAYNEWLLPLRTLVTGIEAENKNDYDQLVVDMVCALNPVELVLYRCIELVEEKLKQ